MADTGKGTGTLGNTKARVTRTIRYMHVAQDAIGAVLNPSVVMLPKGKAANVYVACLIAVGGTQTPPEQLSYLSTTYGGEIASGLTWMSEATTGYGYRLIYNGKTDVNVNIAVRMTYKGKQYPATLSVRTYEEGTPGEDAYSADISPAEVTFVRGKAESVTLDSAIYKGATKLACTVSCNTSLPAFLSFEAPDELSYNGSTAAAVTDRMLTFSLTPTSGSPVMTKTVRVRFEDPPAKGDPSPYCPPPRVWEEYPTGYQFQNGTDEGSDRMDVVLQADGTNGDYIGYKCLVTHVKSDSHQPKNDNNTLGGTNPYWHKEDGRYVLLASKVILAEGAYIDLLSTNGIRIYDSAGNVVGEIVGTTEDGNSFVVWIGNELQNPLWAVDGHGIQYVGGRTGEHIVLDPTQKEIRIYDEDNACVARHSGQYIDPSSAIPNATGQPSGITLNNVTLSASGSKVWSGTTQTVIGNGMLKIPIPSMIITAKRNAYTSTNWTEAAPITRVAMALYVVVNSQTELYMPLGEVASMELNSGTLNPGGGNATTPQTVSLDIPARTEVINLKNGDKYIAMLKMTVTVGGGHGSEGNGKVVFGATTMTCNYTADCYNAHFGQNGWVISSNTDNYAFVLVDKQGVLHSKVKSNGNLFLDTD